MQAKKNWNNTGRRISKLRAVIEMMPVSPKVARFRGGETLNILFVSAVGRVYLSAKAAGKDFGQVFVEGRSVGRVTLGPFL